MGLVYFPTFTIKMNRHVGKYTVRPMDPSNIQSYPDGSPQVYHGIRVIRHIGISHKKFGQENGVHMDKISSRFFLSFAKPKMVTFMTGESTPNWPPLFRNFKLGEKKGKLSISILLYPSYLQETTKIRVQYVQYRRVFFNS